MTQNQGCREVNNDILSGTSWFKMPASLSSHFFSVVKIKILGESAQGGGLRTSKDVSQAKEGSIFPF